MTKEVIRKMLVEVKEILRKTLGEQKFFLSVHDDNASIVLYGERYKVLEEVRDNTKIAHKKYYACEGETMYGPFDTEADAMKTNSGQVWYGIVNSKGILEGDVVWTKGI